MYKSLIKVYLYCLNTTKGNLNDAIQMAYKEHNVIVSRSIQENSAWHKAVSMYK